MTHLPGASIPTSEAVECLDCRVIFSSREVACPKCATVLGLVPVETTAPGREIGRLRDREAWTTAALMQIAHGLHGGEFKAGVARKALAYLAKSGVETETAPESPSAVLSKGERIQ